MLFCIASLIVTNPFVYEDALYDTDRDFDSVAMLAKAPFAILVRDGLPVRNMKELAEQVPKGTPPRSSTSSTES